MIVVAWFVWVAMWFATGYFTVKTVLDRIAYRRMVKQINAVRESYSKVAYALNGEES